MRTTETLATRRAELCLVVGLTLALSGCGGAIRTSSIEGHRVRVDASRGESRTTLRIDQCPARPLIYDVDFDRWGLAGEMEGALFESPEELATQLISADFPARCQPRATPAAE